MTASIATVWIVLLPIVVMMALSLVAGAGVWGLFGVAWVRDKVETPVPAPMESIAPVRLIPRAPQAAPVRQVRIEWRQRRDTGPVPGEAKAQDGAARPPSGSYHAVALNDEGRASRVLCGFPVEESEEPLPLADWEIEWGVVRNTTPQCPVCVEALARRAA